MSNASIFIVISLSGLQETIVYRAHLFSLTALCYWLILFVNISLIVTIIFNENLHDPMYIFVCNMCINGLYGTSGFYPKFLLDLLSSTHTISYAACVLQAFVIYSYLVIDFSILAVMAYDRYVAICRPLEYHSVMSKQRVSLLVFISWFVPLCFNIIALSLTCRLQLCGSHIDKLYCDNWSIVKLACTSTLANNIFGFILICLFLCYDGFIVCTYVKLVQMSRKSTETRKKFMQTCMPHLLCLLNVTVALLFDVLNARYGSTSLSQNVKNFLVIQFVIFPPLLNPIIYGLNLSKVRKSIVRVYLICLNVGNITAELNNTLPQKRLLRSRTLFYFRFRGARS